MTGTCARIATALFGRLLATGWAVGPAQAALYDTLADAVLGQPSMTSNTVNQPDGVPSAANLSLVYAPDVVVAPGGRLYLSDSFNHRILSWADARTFSSGQPADLVIGQPDFVSGLPNAGGSVSPSGFFLPQGLWIDASGAVWVTDAFNSRVLKFNDPSATDVVADLVIGQHDLFTAEPNIGNGDQGMEIARPDGLLFPGRVLTVGTDVYIADSGNSRVLHYSNVTASTPSADKVWGQLGSFTCRAKDNIGTCVDTTIATADNLFNPIGIAVDGGGTLWVADWNNNRVLGYLDALAGDTTADIVLGQADFGGNDENGGGGPTAASLALPIDLAVGDRGQLIIADSLNHRVVVIPHPNAPNARAQTVFGQLGSFTTNAVNHGLGPGATDAAALAGPTGVWFDSARHLYVTDTDNQRLLRFDRPLPPFRIPPRTPVIH